MSMIDQLNEALAGVVEQTQASLVQVTDGPRPAHVDFPRILGKSFEEAMQLAARLLHWPQGAGAGVIVDSSGLILTNAHVVRRQRSMTVTLPGGESHTAAVLARDEANDLALLKIEVADLPAIRFADPASLSAGQWVTAVGHPWGVRGAATAGVVVGGGHLAGQMAAGREWLAASLHLRPGHSGGPLVDSEGNLVGINTMMAGPDVGLVVPIHVIRAFIEAVRAHMDVGTGKETGPAMV
jgi:S1-C subfamily serine protease